MQVFIIPIRKDYGQYYFISWEKTRRVFEEKINFLKNIKNLGFSGSKQMCF